MHPRIRWTLPALAFTTLAGYDGATAPGTNAAFAIAVSGERFVVEVATAAQAQELDAHLASGTEGVINGELLEGDGGYNQPWSWHMDPTTVHTADASIELCDGRPSLIEPELDYWLDTVGRFCPWGAKVVEHVR